MSAAGWDDLIDRHLSRQAVERGLSRHSMEAYAHDLSLFQSWCRDSGLEPAQLDAAALTAYLEALADQGFAVSSQRRHLASLRGLARELVDEKILERDPAPAVKLRPHPRKLPRTLSPADIENLIARDRCSAMRAGFAIARCSRWPTDAVCASRSWSVCN